MASLVAMDGTDEDVLERIQEQGTSFEPMSNKDDEKLNDGNNYKGLMSRDDYKRKRQEVLEDPVAKKAERLADAVQQDRAARDAAAKGLAEREAAKRERLQREIAAADDDAAAAAGDGADAGADAAKKPKKKKKKKPSEGAGLSFDVDD